MLPGFTAQLEHAKSAFLFSFVEGTLVTAIKRGEWVLLDEINLASAETLESLSSLLQDEYSSILLLERGDLEPVRRHPNFRLFACMNPANDAGKRELPASLQSRFTEVWVDSPDSNPRDLALIIQRHLRKHLPPPLKGGDALGAEIAELHTAAKKFAQEGKIVDGAGQKAYVSVRTLSRALRFAADAAPTYGLKRALYDGFQMMYLTMLDGDSAKIVSDLIESHVLTQVKNRGSFLKAVPKRPDHDGDDFGDGGDPLEDNSNYVLFNVFWIRRGPLDADPSPSYVLTHSVEENLYNLARAVMMGKYPILIQGPTSAGKTSMVEYLSKRTGHKFVRVNNHEHTDLQEYIGTYQSNSEGRLVFQEVCYYLYLLCCL